MTDKIIVQFKNHLIEFLDELIEQFPSETGFVLGRLFLKDQIPPERIMHVFIKDVLPHKQRIADRDQDFFLKHTPSLFNGLDPSNVNHFSQLWRSNQLDAGDREAIWRWFDVFVMLVEQYQKKKIL